MFRDDIINHRGERGSKRVFLLLISSVSLRVLCGELRLSPLLQSGREPAPGFEVIAKPGVASYIKGLLRRDKKLRTSPELLTKLSDDGFLSAKTGSAEAAARRRFDRHDVVNQQTAHRCFESFEPLGQPRRLLKAHPFGNGDAYELALLRVAEERGHALYIL